MDKDLAVLVISLIGLCLIFILKRLTVKRLATYHSDILGTIEVWQKYNQEKVLMINNFPQGVSIKDPSITKSYWYFIAEQTVKFCQDKANPKILILGLGAGTISNLIFSFDQNITQTIIEIDQLIVQINRKFFDLDKITHLKLIIADAYGFLTEKNKLKEKFDVIILDIALGKKQIIPRQSTSLSFIKDLKLYLKTEGLIVFNRDAHNKEYKLQNQQFIKSISSLFNQIDNHLIKDPRGYQNAIIIAKT